ncbi:Z354C protein, partial [Piprites chloris]|nr:Z354C protein [Piprites chloris]
MAELRERLEALERRMERAEAALRGRAPALLRLHTVPVRFEDVAVRFSRQEWDSLDEGQRELHRSVMEGNYDMLVSLYCALSKPDLLLWLEREELSTLTESEPEAADVSPEPAVELAHLSCSRGDETLEAKTAEPGEGSCREPEESRNLVEAATFIAPPALTAPVPLEAAVPGDLSQLPPAPSCPLSVCCREAVDQNRSPSPPPTAADTEVEIPMEVPQEEVTVEKLIVPETSSEGPEEEKGLEQEEDVKESGNAGQDPVADVPKGPGKVHSGPEKLEKGSCVGRPAACQRNATREFYSCPICSKSFLLKINFLIHQHGHSNSAPYSCVHCDRKFMSKKKIRRHLRAWAASGTCQPSEPEPCPSRTPCPTSQPQTQVANGTDCGVVWQKPSPARCPLSPGKMLYTCSECLENFSSQSFLTVHQRRHSGRHLILCPCCNQSFSCISDFVRQHWAHTGVRPHQCGICQKTFKRFSHLKEHRRTHMRQNRPLPCADPVPV